MKERTVLELEKVEDRGDDEAGTGGDMPRGGCVGLEGCNNG